MCVRCLLLCSNESVHSVKMEVQVILKDLLCVFLINQQRRELSKNINYCSLTRADLVRCVVFDRSTWSRTSTFLLNILETFWMQRFIFVLQLDATFLLYWFAPAVCSWICSQGFQSCTNQVDGTTTVIFLTMGFGHQQSGVCFSNWRIHTWFSVK